MDTLLKQYDKIYSELGALNQKLGMLYQEIETNRAKLSSDIANANQKLSEDLSENELRIAKVNAFIEIARTHSSTHINASGAKPFDSSILSRLSVQINSDSSNDPYAVQLYTEATAQLIYLSSAVDALTSANDLYLAKLSEEFNKMTSDIERRILITKSEIETYLFSTSFTSFIDLVLNDQKVFGGKAEKVSMSIEQEGTISIGSVEFPLPIPRGMEQKFVEKTKGLCNAVTSTIPLPANFSVNNGFIILAEYTNSSETYVLSGIQNIILNYLRYYGEKLTQVIFIDPIRFNASSLGGLSKLCENSKIIDPVPSDKDAIRKKVKTMVSDAIKKSNPEVLNERKLFVFHDFPNGYDSESIALIRQLCANVDCYGINVVLTHNCSEVRQIDIAAYRYIKDLALNIVVESDNDFYLIDDTNLRRPFTWYISPQNLPNDIVQKYLTEIPTTNLDNLYLNRIGYDVALHKAKGERNLTSIPYGVDNDGKILYLDFEDLNFATYICGASRSGKSTLLHTIITGILKTTHPDNVEMWLVDFGKTEFSRYVNKNIPHIRYIMMDNSPEMVYDLVDRLTEILHSRQNRYMGKWEKLNDVPEEEYMPELFVVIDEFSVMSNVIAESALNGKGNHKIKLQLILSQAAKFGMRFIFSSQTYTNGINGLTDTAKEQIQQRISLKADYNDVKGTLALKNASDRDSLLIDQLPKHYALKKIPLTEQGDQLSQCHVLYIPDVNSQMPLFEELNKTFTPNSVYDSSKFETYIYKDPLIKDGNTYEIFEDQKEFIFNHLKASVTEDEKNLSLFVGSPQRMLKLYPIEMINSFCENCLFIAPTRERESAASIVLSACCSLKMQNAEVECWTIGKNPIFRKLTRECNFSFDRNFSNAEDICERISQMKKLIERKKEGNQITFIMNYETIMMDMLYLLEEENPATISSQNVQGNFMLTQPAADGINPISDFLASVDEVGATLPDSPKSEDVVHKKEAQNHCDEKPASKLYDARNDLKYILAHGPKLGYHFIMQFDTCGDFNQTKLLSSLFKHKIMFQTAKEEAFGPANSSFATEVSKLSGHTFRYTNGIDEVSFNPYLHNGICIDGWSIYGQVSTNQSSKGYLE